MSTFTKTKKLSLISLTAIILGLGLLNISHAQVNPIPLQSEWETSLSQIREDNSLIGVGGAILHKGEIVAMTANGLQIKGKAAPVTADDLWHLGSISKSMSATMIARLVEKDVLSWDVDINAVFKNMNIHPDWKDVRLEHFLTHTSGAQANFPRATQNIWPKTANSLRDARLEAVSDILKNPPSSVPGENFKYSNVGITVAAVIAEKITGKNWETLMHEEVFTPLDMASAGFGAPLSSEEKTQPWGHRYALFMKIPMDPEDRADNTPVMGPAGIIHMKLEDVLKFGQAHLLGMQGKSKFLKQETFKRLHTPHLNSYAYGWVAPGKSEWGNGPILWHNGTNTMWYAVLFIAPEKDAVFIMTANDGNYKKAEKAFFTLPPKFISKLK